MRLALAIWRGGWAWATPWTTSRSTPAFQARTPDGIAGTAANP